MDLLDPPGDEVLPDRLPVGLGEDGLDVAVGSACDLLEDGARVIEARLDALEIEDREPAESRQGSRERRVHHRVHGRRQDRDREVDAGKRLAEVDVGGFDGVRAGRKRDVVEAVGLPDRVHLRAKDPALGGRADLDPRVG